MQIELFIFSTAVQDSACGSGTIDPFAHRYCHYVQIYTRYNTVGTDNGRLSLAKSEQSQLAAFLEKRQLKERIAELLKTVKDETGEKDGYTTSKSATYAALADSIAHTLNHRLLKPTTLLRVLDEAEIAGRQHILIFRLTKPNDPMLSRLAATALGPDDARDLSEYWDVPRVPSRVVISPGSGSTPLMVKVVTKRTIIKEEAVSLNGRDLFERKQVSMRSAVIVKYDHSTKTLQFRTPAGGQSHDETMRGVFTHVCDLMAAVAGDDGKAWVTSLPPFPLGDAYPRVIANTTDFRMATDSPENGAFRGVLSRVAPQSDDPPDLRDLKEWDYANGYSRKAVNGYWKVGDRWLLVRAHWDKISPAPRTSKQVARVYIPGLCTDTEVEHVIQRFADHL